MLARDLREPEHGLDAQAMSTLRSLDLRWSTFRRQSVAPIADSVFSPVFESQAARDLLAELGAELSQHYNTFGMGCLGHSPDIAYECLQRALFAAPRDSPEQALALAHLGVHAQSQNKTSQALRYLHRAVAVQAGSLTLTVSLTLSLTLTLTLTLTLFLTLTRRDRSPLACGCTSTCAPCSTNGATTPLPSSSPRRHA